MATKKKAPSWSSVNDTGIHEESYFDALILMYGQALKAIAALPAVQREPLAGRMHLVYLTSRDFGYAVPYEMADLLDKHGMYV